jgi:hypothetical protein
MKDVYGLLIDKIIHDFKHSTMDIKPGEQKLVVIILKQPVKQGPRKSPANIGFRNSMLKRGIMKQVVGGHTVEYRNKTGMTQGRRMAAFNPFLSANDPKGRMTQGPAWGMQCQAPYGAAKVCAYPWWDILFICVSGC